MRTAKIVCMIVVALSLAGCATSRSSLRAEDGLQAIFVIDESTLFNIAYETISDVYEGVPIAEINNPNRGFSATRRSGQDRYTTALSIIRVRGASDAGTIEGYYFEVAGNGTFFGGPSWDQKTYDNLMERLQQSGKRILVSDAEPIQYELERGAWKTAHSRLDQPKDADAKQRLMALDDLYRDGLISKEEYERKRDEILSAL